jgi:hypothetical protein
MKYISSKELRALVEALLDMERAHRSAQAEPNLGGNSLDAHDRFMVSR